MGKVSLDRRHWDRIHMINLLDVIITHERERCQPKKCMKNIHFIPRPVRNTTGFLILTLQNIIF